MGSEGDREGLHVRPELLAVAHGEWDVDPLPAPQAIVSVNHRVEGLGVGEHEVGEGSPPLVARFPQHGSALRTGSKGEVARGSVGERSRSGHPGMPELATGRSLLLGRGRGRGQ